MTKANDGSPNEATANSVETEKEQALLRELDRALASSRAKPGVFERLRAKTG